MKTAGVTDNAAATPCARHSSACASVESSLLSGDVSFNAFQALRLLEGFGEHPVTVAENGSFALQTAAVESLVKQKDGSWRLETPLSGYLGVDGVLPVYFSNAVTWHTPGAAAFLSIFHNRFFRLSYDAWRKRRAEMDLERVRFPELTDILHDIAGVPHPEDSTAAADVSDMFCRYPGLFGKAAHTAADIVSIARKTLHLPVEIEQYAEIKTVLPDYQRTRIAAHPEQAAFSRLGDTATLGDVYYDRQSCICLTVGPVSYDDFMALQPKQPRFEAFISVLEATLNAATVVDIRLCLDKEQAPYARLNASLTPSPSPGDIPPAPEVFLKLHPERCFRYAFA